MKKNVPWHIPAPRRGCFSNHLPLRRVRILAELFLSYGNEVSYTIKKRPSTENSAKGRLNSNAVPPLFFGKTDLLQRLRRQLFRNLVAVTKNRCPITGTTVKAYHAAAHSALRFQSHIPFSFAQVSFQQSGTLSVSRVNVLFFFLIFVRVLCTL